MRDELDARPSAPAELLVVGSGTPLQAQWFAEDLGLDGRVVTDPSLRVFRQLGLRRSWWRVLHPQVLWRAWNAFRHGYRQEKVQGDPLQLGGVLVIDPEATLRFEYRSRFAGDHPPISAIWSALYQEEDQCPRPTPTTINSPN